MKQIEDLLVMRGAMSTPEITAALANESRLAVATPAAFY